MNQLTSIKCSTWGSGRNSAPAKRLKLKFEFCNFKRQRITSSINPRSNDDLGRRRSRVGGVHLSVDAI